MTLHNNLFKAKKIPWDKQYNLPILQLRELRHREVREGLQGHTAKGGGSGFQAQDGQKMRRCRLPQHISHVHFSTLLFFVTQDFSISLDLNSSFLPSLPSYRHSGRWQSYPAVKEKYSIRTLCQEGLLVVGPAGRAYKQLLSCLPSSTPRFLQN